MDHTVNLIARNFNFSKSTPLLVKNLIIPSEKEGEDLIINGILVVAFDGGAIGGFGNPA